MKNNRQFYIFVCLCVGILGCGKSSENSPKVEVLKQEQNQEVVLPSHVAEESAASGAASTGIGSVKGRAVFEGATPTPEKLQMTADPVCSAGSDALSEDVLVDSSNGIKNVFVYIKSGISGSYPAPSEPAVLDQQTCRYTPHVLGVQVGQPLAIVNSDATLHNVHAMPEKSGQFNLGMPIKGMKIQKKFNQTEVMVKFKCDVHPWMNAYVGVVPHPFFAVTQTDGTYQIPNLPAGKYVLGVWHEKMGEQEIPLDVVAGEETVMDFTFRENV